MSARARRADEPTASDLPDPATLTLPAVLPLMPEGTTPTALGRLLDWDQAERVAVMMGRLEMSAPWWWADLLNQAYLRWGESFAQLSAMSGLDEGTLYNRKSVGVAFPPEARRWNLPFGHYEAVRGLEPEERAEVLDWAEAPILAGAERARSRDEVRDEVRRRRGLPPRSVAYGGPGPSPPVGGGNGAAVGDHPSSLASAHEVAGAEPVFPAANGGVWEEALGDEASGDVTRRLAAWLAEGARLYDAVADGADWDDASLSERDAEANRRMAEAVLTSPGYPGRRNADELRIEVMVGRRPEDGP